LGGHEAGGGRKQVCSHKSNAQEMGG
jgi:hypothetical protein